MLGGKTTSAPIAAANAFYCHDFQTNEGNFVFGSLFAQNRWCHLGTLFDKTWKLPDMVQRQP